jgi:hypothetical protein
MPLDYYYKLGAVAAADKEVRTAQVSVGDYLAILGVSEDKKTASVGVFASQQLATAAARSVVDDGALPGAVGNYKNIIHLVKKPRVVHFLTRWRALFDLEEDDGAGAEGAEQGESDGLVGKVLKDLSLPVFVDGVFIGVKEVVATIKKQDDKLYFAFSHEGAELEVETTEAVARAEWQSRLGEQSLAGTTVSNVSLPIFDGTNFVGTLNSQNTKISKKSLDASR